MSGTDRLPTPPTPTRVAALGGVVGPAVFVAAWAIGPSMVEGYSSVDDAISRLAAIGAESRPLMTAGFVAFGLAVPAYGWALRRSVEGPAWVAAVGTGLATLAVAALPLDHSAAVDTAHAVAATIGYATLAATPLLAARPLARAGHRLLAGSAVLAGSVSTIALVLTATPAPSGLFQRIGLTTTDVWLAASGLAIAAGRVRTAALSSGARPT